MERKDFLKNSFGFLGMALVAPSILKANNNSSCTDTKSETAGPFPTISPANFVKADIKGNRTGLPFVIEIIIRNINQNCNPMVGVMVDIWHCDKDGYYSQYGGPNNQFQKKDMTMYDFLRGRQMTDANGMVSYESIFPGWYDGRSTHVHVHVYEPTGQSILITQIAFPEGSGSAVEDVNAASSYGYTKGMTGYTYNAQDGEFQDGVNGEVCTLTGSVASGGYSLNHTIYVDGSSTTDVNGLKPQSQFKLGKNFPNPCSDETTIPITLLQPSKVKIELLDLSGRKIEGFQYNDSLNNGVKKVTINTRSLNLANGRYIYSVEIENLNGTFKQSGIMVVSR